MIVESFGWLKILEIVAISSILLLYVQGLFIFTNKFFFFSPILFVCTKPFSCSTYMSQSIFAVSYAIVNSFWCTIKSSCTAICINILIDVILAEGTFHIKFFQFFLFKKSISYVSRCCHFIIPEIFC